MCNSTPRAPKTPPPQQEVKVADSGQAKRRQKQQQIAGTPNSGTILTGSLNGGVNTGSTTVLGG